MERPKIIIFIQSATEVIYALYLYQKEIKKADISIYVIKTVGIYTYLSSLNLCLDNLVFIDYPKRFSPKNLYSVARAKLSISRLFRIYFKETSNCTVFFFSHAYDYLTIAFILRLKSRNRCIFFDINPKSTELSCGKLPKYKYGFKEKINLAIHYILLGKKLALTERGAILLYPEDHDIKRELNDSFPHGIIKKYEINGGSNGLSVLIFESPSANISISNYEDTTKKLLTLLIQYGYRIFIKPHPQKGYSQFLDNYKINILDKNVPGELIGVKGFTFVLGINTSAIQKLSMMKGVTNVYSIIKLYRYFDEENRGLYLRDLNLYSSLKIIESIEGFQSLLDLNNH
jgi:hypothetical protein